MHTVPVTYFPIVLPLPVLKQVNLLAQAQHLSRNALLVGILKRGLDPRNGVTLELGILGTGAAARHAKAKTVSVMLSPELKRLLTERASKLSVSQAAIARAVILEELRSLSCIRTKEDGVPERASTPVVIPSLDTANPDSVTTALREIYRQVVQHGQPSKGQFHNATDREIHRKRLELLLSLAAALYGHPVDLSADDVALLMELWGKHDALMVASSLNVRNLLSVAAQVSADQPS